MGYASEDNKVRVDFFKPSGKWYTTESITWDRYSAVEDGDIELIHTTLYRCIKEQLGTSYIGFIAVCLKPFCEASHPIMLHFVESFATTNAPYVLHQRLK